ILRNRVIYNLKKNMKKIISSLAVIGMFAFGFNTISFAQDSANEEQEEAVLNEEAAEYEEVETQLVPESTAEVVQADSEEAQEEVGFVPMLKKKFIEGDPFWMGFVLVDLIIGLAICIERIIYLNLSSINTKKFVEKVEAAVANGNVEEAKDICRNTRGPIASIYYQGLSRVDEGVESVEKTIVSYGGVQMGLLEKGMSWITLFIAMAPMLGFLGTVIGMIFAFEQIVEDGQVSPITVAGGIQVALLTTVFGLLAAMILQIFYNYIVSKVDSIVNEMENASITLVDMLVKYKVAK
ncbi:MAG TPA: MotA/TolQ/ExbB proton channel family protein, partial [Brumimicrobium sp.]|nr:MotA/TolQ/ExbB proton channel family protein [Brumimicrobium sp.]